MKVVSDPREALATHRPMLRRYLFVLGVRPDRVDDLVQDAIVVALQKIEPDADAERGGAFLRGIARNLVLRERTTAGQRREVELADQVWHERCGAKGGEDRIAALRACIDGLPARSRQLLDRRYRNGADRNALAREFDLQPEGVKSLLRRVRDGLKECVERRLGARRTNG